MSKKEYEVGYGKPPEAGRFQKGKSGNPKGRPKGTRNLSTDIRKVLAAKVSITENGKPRKVSTQFATLMRLREKALKGDPRAMERLLELARTIGAEDEARAAEQGLIRGESDIVARFVEAKLKVALENSDDKGDENGAAIQTD
ncbi:DUF5681 domain-containing protein [Marimonas sp. MJW-29]|uniref:DUF5681 domain-containing protein n=1 Tax=Sulfitobacter sediminis TaxID=3234186 RepID=A0ABV3RS71_9RHOB